MMRTLLSLDIASTTGWAFGPIAEGPTVSGYERLAKPRATDEQCWQQTLKWIDALLLKFNPDHVVIEAPVMTASMGGATNPRTMVRLAGLQSIIRTIVFMRLRREAEAMAVSSIRKEFLGKGRLPKGTPKKLVHSRCLELGWAKPELTNHDETDALALWAAFACKTCPEFKAAFEVRLPANAGRVIAMAEQAEAKRKPKTKAPAFFVGDDVNIPF